MNKFEEAMGLMMVSFIAYFLVAGITFGNVAEWFYWPSLYMWTIVVIWLFVASIRAMFGEESEYTSAKPYNSNELYDEDAVPLEAEEEEPIEEEREEKPI